MENKMAAYSPPPFQNTKKNVDFVLLTANHECRNLRTAFNVSKKCGDRPGLKGTTEINRLRHAVARALRFEMDRNHILPLKGDVTVYDHIMAKIPALRELSLYHMDALAKFKRSTPLLEFPALHKELFSVDS